MQQTTKTHLPKRLYSMSELVEVTGLGRTLLYEEMNKNRLSFVKVGTRRLVPQEAVDAWIASKSMAVTA
jgi:excisionase family DNA binding protein